MTDKLNEMINNFETIPFLFIGSGFSRRYFELPDWTSLLKHMVKQFNQDPFAYRSYEDRASFQEHPYGLNPLIATYIEEDFNREWFHNPNIRNVDEKYSQLILNGCSPFKAEVSYYLNESSKLNEKYKSEVSLLRNVAKKSIAGIITTNYDLFFEKYLSEYKSYIGQQSLLFSQLQGIAEVYKIHGSVSDPSSIVINENDYKEFKEKSEYLAAKLLTIFMEYPIIFMGYSISDKNIQDILNSIVKCMTKEQINKLKKKFIFVEYDPSIKNYEIGDSTFSFDSNMLTMTKVTLSDYSIIYKAIAMKKMSIPVRLLRVLKDELYLYTLTNEPTKNIKVAPLDDERVSNDDLVLSIGTTEIPSIDGLRGITASQWYRNIVMHDLQFKDKDLLSYAPYLARSESGKLPINSLYEKKYNNIPGLNNLLVNDFDDIISNTIKKDRPKRDYSSLEDVFKKGFDQNKEMLNMAYLTENQIDFKRLETYLKNIFVKDKDALNIEHSRSDYRTNLRRLIRIYDYLKGKEKTFD